MYLADLVGTHDPGVKTKVFIPNAFTPNGNNLNELFKPEGIFIANYTMKIFNRWGEKIFHWNDVNSGWNGKVTNVDDTPERLKNNNTKKNSLFSDDKEKDSLVKKIMYKQKMGGNTRGRKK